MITYVATGLVALIGCLAAGALECSPEEFEDFVFTWVVLGGGVLAFAKVKFEWSASCLRRFLTENNDISESCSLPKALQPWPRDAERLWRGGLFLTGLGGLTLVVGIWW